LFIIAPRLAGAIVASEAKQKKNKKTNATTAGATELLCA
jgi:hypothetical protein